MVDILKYKNEITNWAGFIGVVTGGVAMYFKDISPEVAGFCGALALLCGAIIGWFTGKQAPKLAVATLLVFALSGCASLSYTAPDGTKVIYTRFMTGADTIKGKAGTATIETSGQKALDPAILEVLVRALGVVK